MSLNLELEMGCEMLEELVREAVVPILRTAHFKKKAHVWNRQRGDFIDAIDIQKSRFAARGTEEFTFNIGVFIPEFFEIVWGKQHGGFVKGYEAVVSTRIGRLLPDSTGKTFDKWWELNSTVALDTVNVELGDALENKVLPFLERFRTVRDIHDYMVSTGDWQQGYPLSQLYLAVAKHHIGDIDDCKSLLRESKWQEHSARVRAALGLEV